MKAFKIQILNSEHEKRVLAALRLMGCRWYWAKPSYPLRYLYVNEHNLIDFGITKDYFDDHPSKELRIADENLDH